MKIISRFFVVLIFIISAFLLPDTVYSQKKSVAASKDTLKRKTTQGIYLGSAITFCGVDVYQNYLENPRRFGFSPRIYWEFSNTARLSLEYSSLGTFNFQPSWEKLTARYFDLNLHLMARMKNEPSIFVLLLGVCNHSWSGNFVAQSAFFDAVSGYKIGSRIQNGWYGFTIGAGVERSFRFCEFFGEYRYRFSKVDQAFAVSDVALHLGIKKKIPLKKIYRKLNDRYTWF
jgi:hypothetical protein